MVTCLICNQQFKRITHKHLHGHNTTLQEYSHNFPNAEMISPEVRERFSTNSLAHFQAKYGEEMGIVLYDRHKAFLAEKNTFDFKKRVHGFTQEQFDEYNARRASTLANFIDRYGAELGVEKWDAYCNKQRVAGISREWFIEKYGQDVGESVFRRVCDSKRHTLYNFICRHGAIDGPIKYQAFLDRLTSSVTRYFVSTIERDVCEYVRSLVPADVVVHDFSTKQFSVWHKSIDKLVCYDSVIPQLKLVFEVNGDYWHCNPTKYPADYIHPHKKITAADIWEADNIKQQAMYDGGYEVCVVWESEWKSDNAATRARIKEYVECAIVKNNKN